MHIVQVLVSLNLGGSELVAVELSEFAASAGHRVTVIAADGLLGDLGSNPIAWEDQNTVHQIPFGSSAPRRLLCHSSLLRA